MQNNDAGGGKTPARDRFVTAGAVGLVLHCPFAVFDGRVGSLHHKHDKGPAAGAAGPLRFVPDQAETLAAARRRAAQPTRPKPVISSAQVAGSGMAETVALIVSKACVVWRSA